MNYKTKILSMLLILMILGCSKNSGNEEARTVQDIQKEEGIPVTTENVRYGIINRVERGNGTLQGIAEATLANGMGGTLSKINVSVGETVSKGNIVAKMEIDGGSPVIVAKSAFEYTSKAYERAQKLYEEGAVSQEQLDGARVQYENAKRQYGQSKVGENVYAPFRGTVLEIMQSKGSKISKETPIVKIADLRKMKVQMQINESVINLFKKDQRAFIVIDGDTVNGKIDRVALSANGMAHSFRVTALFNNPNSILKPGMFKNVNVVVKKKIDAISVPIDVVNYDDKGNAYVYIAKDNIAHKAFITIGIQNTHSYEVLEGLKKNDQIVMTGYSKLRDGSKIKVVNN